MPYIQRHLRDQAYRVPLSAGELNYAITRRSLENFEETIDELMAGVRAIIDAYVTRRGQITYATVNEIIGVLTCAALEAIRRDVDADVVEALDQVATDWYAAVAAPYEDLKRAVNGDVYP